MKLLIAILVLLSGCAAQPPEGLTPQQVTIWHEDRAYERQKYEDERVEDWRSTVEWCSQQSGKSMWYVYRGGQSIRSRRTGIPDRGVEYGCDDTSTTIRTIQRAMGGY